MQKKTWIRGTEQITSFGILSDFFDSKWMKSLLQIKTIKAHGMLTLSLKKVLQLIFSYVIKNNFKSLFTKWGKSTRNEVFDITNSQIHSYLTEANTYSKH